MRNPLQSYRLRRSVSYPIPRARGHGAASPHLAGLRPWAQRLLFVMMVLATAASFPGAGHAGTISASIEGHSDNNIDCEVAPLPDPNTFNCRTSSTGSVYAEAFSGTFGNPAGVGKGQALASHQRVGTRFISWSSCCSGSGTAGFQFQCDA